jgi:PST family polysaccharide transporter
MLKNFKKNQLFKVLSYNWIAVMVQFLSGFISIKFIAHFLGTEGMAFLGNFKNLNTTIKTFSTLGFDNGVTKLISEHIKDQKKIDEIISTTIISRVLVTLTLSIVLCLFANYFSYEIIKIENVEYVIYLLALLLPLYSINVLLIAILNGFQKFKSLISIKIITTLIGLLISVLLIWKQQMAGALIGVASVESLIIIVTIIIFKKTGIQIKVKISDFSKKEFKILMQFSLMTLATALIIPSSHFIIRNQISSSINLDSAGYWEAINRISSYYMVIVSSGFSMYYLPKLSSLKTDIEFKNELINYYKILVPIFIFIVMIIYLLKEQIVLIILNEEFLPVTNLFFWQILGDIFRILYLAFAYQILAKTMTKTYIFSEISYYILYVLFSYFLLKKFNLEGVVISYSIINFLTLLFMIVIFRKILFQKTTT